MLRRFWGGFGSWSLVEGLVVVVQKGDGLHITQNNWGRINLIVNPCFLGLPYCKQCCLTKSEGVPLNKQGRDRSLLGGSEKGSSSNTIKWF